jgi:tetratricopeptide (TPR) repeat protein
MKLMRIAIGLFVLVATQCVATAGSIEKAGMLRRHGLIAQAKVELIDVIFSGAPEPAKAEAYFDLGSIALEEKDVSAALETWTELMAKYPNSKQAAVVKGRIKELSEIVGEVSKTSLENAVAESYIRHADFWSERKGTTFEIDTSWLSHEEAAVKWYDKVIAEFPKSVASRLAYEGKLRTLLGWKEGGTEGESYGVMRNFDEFMPELLSTFAAFESDQPDAPSLQAFRYQIAQAYWGHKDWAKTREWLNLVIQKSDADSFYKDLAGRRLQKVEY